MSAKAGGGWKTAARRRSVLQHDAPDDLAGALKRGLAGKGVPTVIDVVVTRDPARMLPAVDNRTVQARKGDRVA